MGKVAILALVTLLCHHVSSFYTTNEDTIRILAQRLGHLNREKWGYCSCSGTSSYCICNLKDGSKYGSNITTFVTTAVAAYEYFVAMDENMKQPRQPAPTPPVNPNLPLVELPTEKPPISGQPTTTTTEPPTTALTTEPPVPPPKRKRSPYGFGFMGPIQALLTATTTTTEPVSTDVDFTKTHLKMGKVSLDNPLVKQFAGKVLPMTPKQMGIQVKLYTRHGDQVIMEPSSDLWSVKQMSKLVVIIPGFAASPSDEDYVKMMNMVYGYYLGQDVGVMTVDYNNPKVWSKCALPDPDKAIAQVAVPVTTNTGTTNTGTPNTGTTNNGQTSNMCTYGQQVVNTISVGRYLAIILERLISGKKVNPEHVHLVGYDIGAYVAGEAGNWYNQFSGIPISYLHLGRITALDPPAIFFPDVTLRGAAIFVDVIHTSWTRHSLAQKKDQLLDIMDFMDLLQGNVGTHRSIGNVDFRPNGGIQQPSCSDPPTLCNHAAAMKYFLKSLDRSTPNSMLVSVPCPDFANTENCRKMLTEDKGFTFSSSMGMKAVTDCGRGDQYLRFHPRDLETRSLSKRSVEQDQLNNETLLFVSESKSHASNLNYSNSTDSNSDNSASGNSSSNEPQSNSSVPEIKPSKKRRQLEDEANFNPMPIQFEDSVALPTIEKGVPFIDEGPGNTDIEYTYDVAQDLTPGEVPVLETVIDDSIGDGIEIPDTSLQWTPPQSRAGMGRANEDTGSQLPELKSRLMNAQGCGKYSERRKKRQLDEIYEEIEEIDWDEDYMNPMGRSIKEIQDGNFKWVVSITESSSKFLCSGVVIADGWVLTAASCFASRPDNWLFQVHFETNNWISGPKTASVLKTDGGKSGSIRIHEDFTMCGLTNNIALVDTATKVGDFSTVKGIAPVCMTGEPITQKLSVTYFDYGNPEEIVTIPGWGSLDGDDMSNKQQLIRDDIKLSPNYQCGRFSQDSRTQFCTFINDTRCAMDPGSPIVIDVRKTMWLVGLVSGVPDVVPGCKMNTPVIHTRVDLFIPWIKQQLGEAPKDE